MLNYITVLQHLDDVLKMKNYIRYYISRYTYIRYSIQVYIYIYRYTIFDSIDACLILKKKNEEQNIKLFIEMKTSVKKHRVRCFNTYSFQQNWIVRMTFLFPDPDQNLLSFVQKKCG